MRGARSVVLALGCAALVWGGVSDAHADGPPKGAAVGAPTATEGPRAPGSTLPAAGGARTFVYQEGATYAVSAMPGRITDIVLQAGERLVGSGPVAAGDTARWVIGDTISGEGETRRVHVMIKPTEVALATNLIINTDRRTYHLELRSTARSWLSQVAWRYPAPELAVARPIPPITAISPSPDDAVAQLNFAYLIAGPRTPWRPLRAFDDGARTYVEFAPSIVMTELPPLYVIGADGKTPELINYRVTGTRIVIDRILHRAELRLGQGRSERRVRIVREAAQ